MKLFCSFVFCVIDGAAVRWCQSPSFRRYRRDAQPHMPMSVTYTVICATVLCCTDGMGVRINCATCVLDE